MRYAVIVIYSTILNYTVSKVHSVTVQSCDVSKPSLGW